jgi:broad specificity phosphatase PhoE
MQRLFVGRHGRIDKKDEDQALSEEGIGDAHSMAGQLRAADLAPNSIILSSLADRVLQTAGIIKVDLGIPTLVRSPFIEKVGLHPEPVEDLRGFIGDVIGACALEYTDSDVVVITHAPLVKAVAGQELEDGQIYSVPEGWQNPAFNSDYAFILQEPDLW